MRAGAFLVHASFGCFAVFFAFQYQIYRLLVRFYTKVIDSLDIDAFVGRLSDLQKLHIIGQKVKYLLIVNFHVRTFE